MNTWSNFFVATAGAAAALTGLIFVGVSISLKKILSIAGLPGRALLSMFLLLAILIFSILFLVPGQSSQMLGIEVVLIASIIWLIITIIDRGIYRLRNTNYRWQYITHMLVNQLAVLPYIICGIMILLNGDNGIYWIVPAMIFSFIKAMLDAWVLLVEIHR